MGLPLMRGTLLFLAAGCHKLSCGREARSAARAAARGVRCGEAAGAANDGAESADEIGAVGAQFGEVMAGEAGENAAASRSNADGDAPAVSGMAEAAGEAPAFEAVDEFDGGVVIEEEALGELADGGFGASAAGGDHHQHLVLLWSEAGFARGAAAEIEKAADLISKLRE